MSTMMSPWYNTHHTHTQSHALDTTHTHNHMPLIQHTHTHAHAITCPWYNTHTHTHTHTITCPWYNTHSINRKHTVDHTNNTRGGTGNTIPKCTCTLNISQLLYTCTYSTSTYVHITEPESPVVCSMPHALSIHMPSSSTHMYACIMHSNPHKWT